MGRKGRIWGIILILTTTGILLPSGCSDMEEARKDAVSISFSGAGLEVRSGDPDEGKISDISLMIFDMSGEAEECIWLEGGITECQARLMTGKKYIFCACANFGYQVYADRISELDEVIYQLAYPDEYRQGMPMYAYQEMTVDGGDISVRLERLMAKISLQMDRSRLSEDVEIFVRSVRIGNCPRKIKVFGKSGAEDEDWCFPSGFHRDESQSSGLNTISDSGMSGSISLYMLENMQGDMPEDVMTDGGKVFDEDDPMREVCSYIEMELEYMSDTYYSIGKGLVYRFYLGEGRNNLDIGRNCHYHITVTPEDDGLSDDSWRVDKRNLTYCGPTGFKPYPSEYIVGDIGDRIHVWCEFFPEDAPFDVGVSDMEFDRENGIYDYVIDEDGHGAVLTLKKPGTGMIYMEAGPPVNDAALFFIEVNQP